MNEIVLRVNVSVENDPVLYAALESERSNIGRINYSARITEYATLILMCFEGKSWTYWNKENINISIGSKRERIRPRVSIRENENSLLFKELEGLSEKEARLRLKTLASGWCQIVKNDALKSISETKTKKESEGPVNPDLLGAFGVGL